MAVIRFEPFRDPFERLFSMAASSTLLGRSEGGGEPAERDGLPAQGAGAEDEGQDDLQFSQGLVKGHPGAATFGPARIMVMKAWYGSRTSLADQGFQRREVLISGESGALVVPA